MSWRAFSARSGALGRLTRDAAQRENGIAGFWDAAAEFRLSSTEPDRGKSSSASHYDQTVSTHPPAGQVCRQSHKRPLD